jgi:hypothetical protein
MERDLKDILVERSIELFYSTEEPVYSVNVDWPNKYPLHYNPYDVGCAALEALIEVNLLDLLDDKVGVLKLINEVTDEASPRIPDRDEITLSRVAAANALNNYGGPEKFFSPN